MVSFLKDFLRRPADEPAESQASAVIVSSPERAVQGYPQGYPNAFAPVARPVAARPVTGRAAGTAKGIEIALQSIINTLPLELQPRLLQRDVGGATIAVPLEIVLSQLSRGSVTLSYGQLRQAAPFAFSPEPDRDKTLVPLPLSEIISKINPNIMTCRRAQRQVEVPADI